MVTGKAKKNERKQNLSIMLFVLYVSKITRNNKIRNPTRHLNFCGSALREKFSFMVLWMNQLNPFRMISHGLCYSQMIDIVLVDVYETKGESIFN